MKKKAIIAVSLVIFLAVAIFVIMQIHANDLHQRELETEWDRVRNIQRAVIALEGEFDISYSADGFPVIEYTLETNMALLSLGGLQAEFGIQPDMAMEVLLNQEHPLHDFASRWVHSGRGYGTPRAEYSNSLSNSITRNLDTLTQQFPDINWLRVQFQDLPQDALEHLIKLEAEQRKVQ